MTAITLEAIQARQTELAAMIEQLTATTASKTTLLCFPEVETELQPGEHYAGPVLSAEGHVQHHLVLMAQRPASKLNWQDAMDWAASVGAALPTRQEQALLYANCKPHLDPSRHWSCETDKDDASIAWGCYFDDGIQYSYHKSYEGSAVAVRRC
jgi:hypothetical protein